MRHTSVLVKHKAQAAIILHVSGVWRLPGVGALLHFMAHLHCSCGPLTGEATEGSSQVMACTALQLAAEVLQPTLAPACPELAALPDALVSAAGGSSDNTLEVEDALELLLAAWLAQRAADQQQLEVLVRMVDSKGRGMALQDDFAALLKQASGLAGRSNLAS